MWDELRDIYDGIITEEFQGVRADYPRVPRGYRGPQEAGRNLTYRNNKVGLQAPNLAALSQAGEVPFGNPTEQEEVIEGQISKNDLFKELAAAESKLGSSPTDRVALLVIAGLRKKFK